ncbi:hypothetical protein [Mesorhizobium sp. M0768]|uniref:hypothetical protein n=1 Tax=Mesorhizobium sp. M0768 TaxID=2956996 RepID=UPI00333B1F90
MPIWRILKEQVLPLEDDPTEALASWSTFVATGDDCEGDHTDVDAHIAALQAEQGGCFAAEKEEI